MKKGEESSPKTRIDYVSFVVIFALATAQTQRKSNRCFQKKTLTTLPFDFFKETTKAFVDFNFHFG